MLGYGYEQQHILLREYVVRHAWHQADHQKPACFVKYAHRLSEYAGQRPLDLL